MPPSYNLGLVVEIHHFDVKDHVTTYVLMIWQWCNTFTKNFKGNMHIFHLLFNLIVPEGSTSGTMT